ncbi:hypothetical protein DPMN_190156 [Dreissena polymorpha]|uniref:RING-type domain-containing protein n=1 Tax=Dreissena polymorpha TaxID=45954 RepID=A0A9D4DVN0_DREPO|nr:hypothetical protein DPMN_190156 [Dreissena polymorpha]
MAERKIKNLTSDYLTCTICFNVFSEPKMLHCGHSFCAKCLEGYIRVVIKQRDFFECPICRDPYQIPNADDIKTLVNSFNNDSVSLSILQALGVQARPSLETGASFTTDSHVGMQFSINSPSDDELYCACARHTERHLDTFCAKHEIVVCGECAETHHSGPECDCSLVKQVINRRLNALKSLIAQQTSDADRLFDSDTAGVKTVRTVYADVQKCISDVEESFEDICRTFKRRIESVRTKAKATVDQDKTCTDVRKLQADLVSGVKSLESETILMNPNEILKTIASMCLISSELQMNIAELAEKIKSGSLMKYVENDLNLLDSFVSGVKATLPDEFMTIEENYKEEPNEKDFVVITSNGTFADRPDAGNEKSDVYMQVTFSAKCPREDKCMLSGVALTGTSAAIIVDQKNKKIKKFKIPEGTFLHELVVTNEPHQVATLRESSHVAVSLWDVPKILLLSTDPVLKVITTIETATEYIGITSHLVDRLAVASIQARRVDVIDTEERDDHYVRKSETLFQSCRRRSFPDRLTATSDGNVVVRNRRRNEISCFGGNKLLLWSRRLKHSVADIACVRGRLYATFNDRNEIASIREDGQGPVEILSYKDFVKRPWAIDGFKDCLIVTEDAPSDKVHLFLFV